MARSLNEAVKVKIMRRVKRKKDQMEKYKGKICPKVQVKLNKLIDIAAYHQPEFSSGPQVSVTAPGGPYIVNLEEKTCTCRRWQLTGLPCSHAICSIRHNNQRVEDFVSECYHVSTFMEMYSNYINLTNSEELGPEVENPGWLFPPPEIKRKRGRKKTARRKDPEEIEKAKESRRNANNQAREDDIVDVGISNKLSKRGLIKMRCSMCGKEGHNKRHHAAGGKKTIGQNSETTYSSNVGRNTETNVGRNTETTQRTNAPNISENRTQPSIDHGCSTQGIDVSKIHSQVDTGIAFESTQESHNFILCDPTLKKYVRSPQPHPIQIIRASPIHGLHSRPKKLFKGTKEIASRYMEQKRN
ncbi:uncharacterized protein [Euphorbia lathyris]|uniref:uncharacterized protein isoform X2 n=1 Tax=Euphorbia lathyris TaxID=212925 RepID=UPI00331432C8